MGTHRTPGADFQAFSPRAEFIRGWTQVMALVGTKPLLMVLQISLVAAWAVAGSGRAAAKSSAPAPIYWQEKMFYIPYQANPRRASLQSVKKVQLLLSRDGVSDWHVLQEAQPNVKGFSYHAPNDGEYWFALTHQDRFGRARNDPALQPKLRIVVDTKAPEIKLNAVLGVGRAIVVRYEARDTNLSPNSLVVEARVGRQPWAPIAVGIPEVSQSDRLVGQVTWQPPADAMMVDLRAGVVDLARRQATATTEVILSSPALPSRVAAPTAVAGIPGIVTREAPHLPARDWPTTNLLETPVLNNGSPESIVLGPSGASSVVAPPIDNAYAAAVQGGGMLKTPAQLIASGSREPPVDPSAESSDSLDITRLNPESTPQADTATSSVRLPDGNSSWTATAGRAGASIRSVNSRTFDVEYDLVSVGPWGISKIELWGTHDGGHSWQSYGVDPDNRSPLRVTVPGSGVYGFRILVHGANGGPAKQPPAGEEPELVVAVDLSPPTVELISAQLGQGELAGHLVVKWRATDTNLETRPIGLFFSSSPVGSWSTIATGLENSGEYSWRIERHMPARFYLRIEVRDIAGNMATLQSDSPISLPRSQPTGKLRNVRPVDNSPTDLRAAQPLNQR
ncbi:MAG: hypothetical protein MK171_04780 [Pirellulales bacterium]|nr:hypothetical protein [Pirellulales bacterium]